MVDEAVDRATVVASIGTSVVDWVVILDAAAVAVGCVVAPLVLVSVVSESPSGQPGSGRQGSTEQHPLKPLSQEYHCLPEPEGQVWSDICDANRVLFEG